MNNNSQQSSNENIQPSAFRRNFYNNTDSGRVYLLAIFAPLLVSLLISMIGGLIAGGKGVEASTFTNEPWYQALLFLASPIAFFSIFLLYNKASKISYSAVGFKIKVSWQNILLAIAIAVIALFGLQYFINFIDVGLEKIGYELAELTIPNNNFGWLCLNTLLIAILPAIGEELIFRGMILQGLRRNFSDALAILISALMFAVMHGSLQQFIYPILLGLITGWIVVRSGNLLLSIIVHFVNNFLVVLFDFLEKTTSIDIKLPVSWWGILISILLLVITGVILYLVDRLYFKHKNQTEEYKKELTKKPSLYLIISWAVAIILLIIATIVNFIGK